jgi:hypothetical protein
MNSCNQKLTEMQNLQTEINNKIQELRRLTLLIGFTEAALSEQLGKKHRLVKEFEQENCHRNNNV